MSDSIDDLVVFAEFDNKAFNSKIAESLKALEDFEKGLEMKDATKGLAGIDAAADSLDFSGVVGNIAGISKALDSVSFQGIAEGVEHIASRFNAMGAVAFAVIQRMTNAAIDFAKQTASLVFDPLLAGGRSRALNIEAAKFQFRGLGIDVTAAMESALAAVKGTAYGLDEAAKVAAQFGASGIKAGQDMTDALRGISGAAAMTNSSFTEIGQIYTGIAGIGKVTNQDFMQFATRGLNAAAAIGKVLGKTEAQIREMATNGEIDFKTFAKAMDTAFGVHATKANETYTGSLANMRAALSRIGASFIAPYLEGLRKVFNALTPAIDSVATALKPMIDLWVVLTTVVSNKLVKFLEGLDFGPLTLAIALIAQGLGSLIGVVAQIVRLFGVAFGDRFLEGPKSLGAIMVDLSKRFSDFLKRIKPSQETLSKIRMIFNGLVGVISIVVDVVKIAGKALGELFHSLNYNSNGGVLDFFVRLAEWVDTAADAIGRFNWDPIKLGMFLIGDSIANVIGFISQFVDAFKEAWAEVFPKEDGERVGTTFAKIADAIRRWSESIQPTAEDLANFKDNVVEFIRALQNAPENIKTKFNEIVDSVQATIDKVKEFFGFGEESGGGGSSNRIEQRADQVKGVFDRIREAVQSFMDFIKGDTFQGALDAISEWCQEFKDKLKEAFGPGDFNGSSIWSMWVSLAASPSF
jgi:tape measure domain-containing protein